ATMGRSPDVIPWELIGHLAFLSTIQRYSSDYAANLPHYFEYAAKANLHLASVAIEPQGLRSRASQAGEERSAVMRIAREDKKGVYISGAKAVGSAAAQANETLVGSISYPHVRPDESFWLAIPIGTPGLLLLPRESVSDYSASTFDHPITSRG